LIESGQRRIEIFLSFVKGVVGWRGFGRLGSRFRFWRCQEQGDRLGETRKMLFERRRERI
jgi:hypothetical protein